MSTTFADLIAQPGTHKVTLAEIVAGQRLTFATQVSGNTYSLSPYLYDTLNLTNGRQSKIPKVVTSMVVDGVTLTAQTSLANVEATNNSFWHDTANQILYMNTGGGGGTATPPNSTVIMAYFTLYFGSEGMNFNGHYYEAYISAAPSVGSANQNLLSGYMTVGNGAISFTNADGFFDVISQLYVWENNTVTVLIGGGDPGYPYSQFQKSFVGFVTDVAWALDSFTLTLRDYIQSILRQIPEQVFTKATYPNMFVNAVGTPIPIAYGVFDVYSAPDVTAIDEAIAANCVRFKIAQHEIVSIEGVYISNDNGNTYGAALTLNGVFPAAPAGANQFNQSLNGATPAEIVVNLGSGVYDNKKVKVKVAFHGKPTAPGSGITMVNPSNVVQDLLTTYNYFTSANLNLSSFNLSAINSSFSVNLYLNAPTRTADVITKICNSDLAFFFTDLNGLLNYVSWQPSLLSTVTTTFDESAVFSLAALFAVASHFTTIQVGYGFNAKNGSKYAVFADTEYVNMYNQNQLKTVDTYLTLALDAQSLAVRLGFIHAQPFETLTMKASWAAAQINTGDKIILNLKRAPASSGNISSQVFEVISVVKDFVAGMVDLVVANWHETSLKNGWWTLDSAPAWGSAQPSDKAQSGYWTYDDGYIVEGNPTTLNKSLWW